MFRIKLSKFKQVIAVAIIPRIFVRDTKPLKNKLNNYTLDVFSFARKSTDSGSKDDEIEKQREIIDKCFGETPQPSESKDVKDDASEIEKEHKSIVSSDYVRLSDAEKCDISNAPDNEPGHATSEMQTVETSVQATTANIAEETLDQRVETIDETPHVEASSQKTEGFNSTPKVLGHDIEFFADEKVQKIDLDDLAKRCVGAPIGNIDEMLIKEMKNMAKNGIKSQTDMNLIKSHGIEKYYSGIFEHLSQKTKKTPTDDFTPKEPLYLFYKNEIIGDNEMKSEPITPLHIDAVHLFAFDEGSKDYKETGLFQDSSVYLSSEIEEPLLDFQSTITPYESPAMPFYEYVNKELIIVDNLNEKETMTISKRITDARSEADNTRSEEYFLRKEDTDVPGFVKEKHEMNQVESEPTLSHTAKPILVESKLKEDNIPGKFRNLSREQLLKLLYFYKNPTVNKTAESHVFSTSEETPPVPAINPAPNSSISSTFVSEAVSKESDQNIEIPADSAISAHQNPGEYYNMILNKQQHASNLSEEQQTLIAENHIIHTFCTQLQEIQDDVSKETEASVSVLEYPVLLHDPFSYIILKPEMTKNTVNGALQDEVTAKTIDNVTDFIKKDTTRADEGVPLSQILKRIRDKNRLEFCRNLLLQSAKQETSKNFTCMALESNKQKSSPPPCKPPPKPPKEKCPKPCPPPCPPKKDPCAKLIPFFLNTIIRFDVQFDIQGPMKQHYGIYYYKNMLTDDIIERLRKLGETLRFVKVDRDKNYMKDATCARDFEPWIPIPSWPAPKVVKKRPFVCPKEGCKPVPVPRSNPPKQRPCLGVPKKFFNKLGLAPVNTPDIIFIQL